MDYTLDIPAFISLLQGFLASQARTNLRRVRRGEPCFGEEGITRKLLNSLQVLLLLEELVNADPEPGEEVLAVLLEKEAIIVGYCLGLADLQDSTVSPYNLSLPLYNPYALPGAGGGGDDGGPSGPVYFANILGGAGDNLSLVEFITANLEGIYPLAAGAGISFSLSSGILTISATDSDSIYGGDAFSTYPD